MTPEERKTKAEGLVAACPDFTMEEALKEIDEAEAYGTGTHKFQLTYAEQAILEAAANVMTRVMDRMEVNDMNSADMHAALAILGCDIAGILADSEECGTLVGPLPF